MFNPHYSPYIIYLSTFTPRTPVESGAIFHDGYEFLKIYKRLTVMSLRLGFQGVGLKIEHRWHTPLGQFQIGGRDFVRLGIQEWFLRPKCHAPWQQSLLVELLASILVFEKQANQEIFVLHCIDYCCCIIWNQDATQFYKTYPALIASAWLLSKSMQSKPFTFWNWGTLALVGLCSRPQTPVNKFRFDHRYSVRCSVVPPLNFLNKSRLMGHGSGSNPRFFHGFVDEDGMAYLKRCLVFGFGLATVPNQLVLIIFDPVDAFWLFDVNFKKHLLGWPSQGVYLRAHPKTAVSWIMRCGKLRRLILLRSHCLSKVFWAHSMWAWWCAIVVLNHCHWMAQPRSAGFGEPTWRSRGFLSEWIKPNWPEIISIVVFSTKLFKWHLPNKSSKVQPTCGPTVGQKAWLTIQGKITDGVREQKCLSLLHLGWIGGSHF